jgi:hypothetical protein
MGALDWLYDERGEPPIEVGFVELTGSSWRVLEMACIAVSVSMASARRHAVFGLKGLSANTA